MLSTLVSTVLTLWGHHKVWDSLCDQSTTMHGKYATSLCILTQKYVLVSYSSTCILRLWKIGTTSTGSMYSFNNNLRNNISTQHRGSERGTSPFCVKIPEIDFHWNGPWFCGLRNQSRSFRFSYLRPRLSACLTKAWRLYSLEALVRQAKSRSLSNQNSKLRLLVPILTELKYFQKSFKLHE